MIFLLLYSFVYPFIEKPTSGTSWYCIPKITILKEDSIHDIRFFTNCWAGRLSVDISSKNGFCPSVLISLWGNTHASTLLWIFEVLICRSGLSSKPNGQGQNSLVCPKCRSLLDRMGLTSVACYCSAFIFSFLISSWFLTFFQGRTTISWFSPLFLLLLLLLLLLLFLLLLDVITVTTITWRLSPLAFIVKVGFLSCFYSPVRSSVR